LRYEVPCELGLAYAWIERAFLPFALKGGERATNKQVSSFLRQSTY
jgi:hypothetical protein